jgi:hypothetical protein
VNDEAKEQLKQCVHTHSPVKLKKFKRALSAYQRADGDSVFGVMKEVMMVKSVHHGTTIMSEMYCKTLKDCLGPFRIKSMEC